MSDRGSLILLKRGWVSLVLAALAVMASPPAAGDDAGGDAGGVQAMAGHLLISGMGEQVRVTEVFALTGEAGAAAGDAGPSSSVRLSVPAEAGSVALERGQESWRLEGQELVLTGPLAGGQQTLAFSFTVPFVEGRAVISHTLPFPVAGVSVIWGEGSGMTVRAMGFSDRGVVEMGPRRMRVADRAGLEPGQRLVLLVTPGEEEAPAMAAEEPTSVDPLGRLRWVTLVVALLLGAAGFLGFGRMAWRERS